MSNLRPPRGIARDPEQPLIRRLPNQPSDEGPQKDRGPVKRFVAILAILVAVVAAAVGAFFWSTAPDSDEPERVPVELTAQDLQRIEEDALAFLESAGNFGLKADVLDPSNVMDVKRVLTTQDPEQTNLYESRESAARYIRDTYTLNAAPQYVGDAVIEAWDTLFESSALTSYELESSSVTLPEQGYRLVTGATTYDAVTVDATFSSRVTKRQMAVTDASSDGSFGVYSRGFANSTVEITFVKDDTGTWKVYELKNYSTPILLASYLNPTEDLFNQEQEGFQEIDVIQGKLTPIG